MIDNRNQPDGNESILAFSESPDIQKHDLRISSDTRSSRSSVSSEKPQSYHETTPYSLRHHLKKTLAFFVFIFLAVWIMMFFSRGLVDSILQRIDSSKTIHHDTSKIDTGVTPQVKPKVTLVYRLKDGQLLRVLADEEAVSEFTRESVNMLESARIKLRGTVRNRIHDTVNATFQKMRGQVDLYADWYFAWSTTYKILGEAITSAADHSLKAEAMSLKDAVADDVEKYLQKHFEEIVLQPEISDGELKTGFESVLKEIHHEFLIVMSQLDQQFQKFVSKQSTLFEPVDTAKAKVDLDWDSQFHKVTTTGHEKGVGGSLVGVGIVTSGTILGKTIATALGKATVGKLMSGAALKGLITKLATPFVTKVGFAAAGTASGAVAGPVGAAVGAIAGVSVDYLVSKGVELGERDSFVTDTNIAINAIQREWENDMIPSLEKATDLWFEDTINLFSEFSKK